MCIQYINDYNIEFGTNVIGLDDEAISLLQQFQWENNLMQFQQVIKQLVASSEKSYITKKQVQAQLNNIKNTQAFQTVDLSKTLEEIETDIIQKVVTDENMNYTAAAKRLNISRSTLSRKLPK